MKIDINPMGAVRQTRADAWRQRPAVLRYYAYKDALRLAWGGQEVPERLRLEFVLPMPKSWSKKLRTAQNGQPHKQRPDTDNLTKAVKDALCLEDGYIWDEHSTKYWGETGSVTITELKD